MSNRTDPMALSVHGTNPQNLVEKILRMKIYANSFWKEKCFGLTAATLVDRAMELDMYGGTYGGNKKPSKFMCLILKMLQIQPEKDIVVEFIKNEEFRYVRVLGAFYLRLVGRPIDVYKYIEPLLNDFRRIRFKTDKGYRITHVDEFADELLHSLTSCDITLPHLPKRYIMEITQDLEPYVSMLDDEDLPDFNQEEKEKEEEKNKEKKQRDKETDRRDNRDKERDRDRRDRRDDDRDRERDRDRRDRDREDRDRGRDREDRDRDRDRRDRDRDNDRDRRDRDRDNDRDRDRDRDRRDRDRDADRDKDRGRDRRDDDDEERRRKRDREEERERKDDLPKDSSSRDKEKERERDRARIARMERSSGSSTNKKKESKAAVGGGGGGAVESMSVEETNKLRAQLGLPLLK